MSTREERTNRQRGETVCGGRVCNYFAQPLTDYGIHCANYTFVACNTFGVRCARELKNQINSIAINGNLERVNITLSYMKL